MYIAKHPIFDFDIGSGKYNRKCVFGMKNNLEIPVALC